MMLALGALLLLGLVEAAHGNVRYQSQFGSGFRANVTVNSQPVSRHGEYYRASIDVPNSAANMWQAITNTAVLNRSGTSDLVIQTTGGLVVPKNPQVFLYDLDGNLTNDLVWSYTWDAENRLIAMDCLVAGPTAQHLTFEYDWRGRRIRKWVKNGSNGTVSDTRYIYDGWNLLGGLNASSTVVRSYLWGTDLSGSMQGAGGVGGLLAVGDKLAGIYYFVANDANGNVVGLVNATDGSYGSKYEYGPFGELIRATGPMASANPFRFSTKFTDDETDLVYYRYRYYSPSLGRWLSRDPMEEKGGLNLYGFCVNDPIVYSGKSIGSSSTAQRSGGVRAEVLRTPSAQHTIFTTF
jgi:RHS repeat-associated protein